MVFSGCFELPAARAKAVREPAVRAIVTAMPTFILSRLMLSPPFSMATV